MTDDEDNKDEYVMSRGIRSKRSSSPKHYRQERRNASIQGDTDTTIT
jgi:hypothetical protein